VFERMRRTLVESLIGAIALGYLLALDIGYFVNIFVAPVAAWAARRDYQELYQQVTAPTHASAGFPFRDALPELASFLLFSLVWYLLFRWLYFKPFKEGKSEPARSEN
jgi:hypothetical protein